MNFYTCYLTNTSLVSFRDGKFSSLIPLAGIKLKVVYEGLEISNGDNVIKIKDSEISEENYENKQALIDIIRNGIDPELSFIESYSGGKVTSCAHVIYTKSQLDFQLSTLNNTAFFTGIIHFFSNTDLNDVEFNLKNMIDGDPDFAFIKIRRENVVGSHKVIFNEAILLSDDNGYFFEGSFVGVTLPD